VGDQVEHPELTRYRRILELKIRIEVKDAVVPSEFAVIDHQGHRRSEEPLGSRADLEHRARTDWLAAALLRTPKTLPYTSRSLATMPMAKPGESNALIPLAT
jgi:hypothetical protein